MERTSARSTRAVRRRSRILSHRQETRCSIATREMWSPLFARLNPVRPARRNQHTPARTIYAESTIFGQDPFTTVWHDDTSPVAHPRPFGVTHLTPATQSARLAAKLRPKSMRTVH